MRYGRLKSHQSFNRYGEAAGPPTQYDYGAEPAANGLGFIRWERETLPYQNPTTRVYDALDRLVETRFPDGAVETRTYGCCATATDVRRNGQLVSRASYDGLGRLREERRYGHPDADIVCAFTRYAYDCVGRIVSEEEGVYLYSRAADEPLALATATNVYDGAGRLVYHASRSGPPARYAAYTPQGQPCVILHGADAARREERGYYADGSLAWHAPVTGRVTYYVYNGDGNTIRETDPNGNVVTREYDYAGNMTAEKYYAPGAWYPAAERVFSYDANGNLIAETSETGVKTFYTYDALNRQTSHIIDRNGNQAPDADDFIETNIYAAGAGGGLLETRIRPGGYQQVSEYDRAGRLQREYTHSNFVTEYSYDGLFGRLTQTDAPAANNQRAITRSEYSLLYRTASIDALGRRTDYAYDGLGRVVEERRPDGVARRLRYYAGTDLPAIETLSDGAQILDQYIYLYDSLYNRTGVVHDLDHDAQTTPADHCTLTDYTLAGEPARVYGANVYPATYSYDANGNLTAVTDGNGNVTRFVYDYRNRLLEKIYADSHKTEFTYYENGLLRTRRDARGNVTTYTYDALGNVTNVQYAGAAPDVAYRYSNAGLLTHVFSAGETTLYNYYAPGDAAGAGLPLLKSETNPRGTLTYTWWPDGSRQSLRVAAPAGELYTATYAFDPHARLTELAAAVPGQPTARFTYIYKPQTDLIAELRSSHGVGQTYEYDRLQRRRATAFQLAPGADVWRESFGYNAAGFRVQRTNDFGAARPALVDAFTYDELGQLTAATRTKGAQPRKDYFFAWRYDTVGNRVNEQRAGFSFGFWYNRLNQMTARQWQGGLTVSGRTQPGAANAAVNATPARVDADGGYIVEELDVTTPLLSDQGIGDGRTRDLVTAVNTNMTTQSILWETIRMAPQQVEMSYDADGNLTSDGRIAYTWDAENRLIRCEDIDLHAKTKRRSEYVYDGQMRRIEKREYEHDGAGWKVLVTTKYLYDGWDIVAAYVTTGNATTAHAYLYGADLSGTLSGAGGIGGLVAELRFTICDLRFGADGTTKTRRHEDDLQFTNYNLQFEEGETVAAIADRGKVAAAAAVESACPVVRGGSEAAALSEGAPLPCTAATVAAIGDRGKVAAASCRLDDGESTRNQDGSSTVAAASCRLRSQDGSATSQDGASPVSSIKHQVSTKSNVILYVDDSMGNVRHKVLVGDGSPRVAATYEYDPFGRLLYAGPPPVYEIAPQFLFSTKQYESHWQHYYYGYRYYSPDYGRWLNRDPIGAVKQDMANLYEAFNNVPTVKYDALGQYVGSILKQVFAGFLDHTFWGTRGCYNWCWPAPNPAFQFCLSLCGSVEILGCCNERTPKDCIVGSITLEGGVFVAGTKGPREGFSPPPKNWLKPISIEQIKRRPGKLGTWLNVPLLHSIVPLRNQCPRQRLSGTVTAALSAGVWSYSMGIRGWMYFPGPTYRVQVGMNVAQGTGISAGGGIVLSHCVKRDE